MRQKRRKGATNGGETGAAMDLEDDSSVNLPGNATKQLQIISLEQALTTIQSAPFDQFIKEVSGIDFSLEELAKILELVKD